MQLGVLAVPQFIATALLLAMPTLAVAEDLLPTPDYHRQTPRAVRENHP